MKVCRRDLSHLPYLLSICAWHTIVTYPLCKVIFSNSLYGAFRLGLILGKMRGFRYFDVDIFNRKVLA